MTNPESNHSLSLIIGKLMDNRYPKSEVWHKLNDIREFLKTSNTLTEDVVVHVRKVVQRIILEDEILI